MSRRHDIDEFLASHLPAFAAAQEAYLAAHGRYFQALSPVASPPADPDRAAPDYSRRPTDVEEGLDDFGLPFPETLPCALRVDVYDGPAGRGWSMTITADEGGVLWERGYASGPEAAVRSHGWREVPPGVAP